MPLRIAHVANEPFGTGMASGVQQAVYCLSGAQVEMGDAVAVISRDDQAVYQLAPEVVSAPIGQAPRANVRHRTVRQRLLGRYREPALLGDLLAWRPQLVHFHSVHIPQNVVLAEDLDRAGIPYCVTVHGGLFRQAQRRGLARKLLFTLVAERRYLRRALFLHALTPAERDSIRSYRLETPVVVAPNGLPPNIEASAREAGAIFETFPRLEGRRIVMFVGRLDPWQKGLDLLIDAFAEAGPPTAALVLVGPDWFGSQAQLAARAAALGVEVLFHPPAFGSTLAGLLAAADVFVHPSRWEGVSLSVLSAAAAGKPCLVTTAADPLGTLARAGAAITVETSVASIGAGLRRAAALPDRELQAMGERGRRAVQATFSWSSLAAALAAECREKLADRPSS